MADGWQLVPEVVLEVCAQAAEVVSLRNGFRNRFAQLSWGKQLAQRVALVLGAGQSPALQLGHGQIDALLDRPWQV